MPPKVLVVDNYDSFVYNLVHYLEAFDARVTVCRNDTFQPEFAEKFDKIVLSPGPGLPEQAGVLNELIRLYGTQKSMLGICLGQQAIGEVFGATLHNLSEVYHGVAHTITITASDEVLFKGLNPTQQVGRYHSWTVASPLPDCLEITAVDSNGHVMSLRHKNCDLRAVQFHPESILTPNGKQMLQNWLEH